MLAVQPRLPLALAQRPRQRSVRRPFHPSRAQGPYRLPHDVHNRLTAALASFRNREASYALAVFLARFWSTPSRIVDAFPIDRRELADREDLGLTERQVRSAIKVLEDIGFLDRTIASGSKYKPTEDGLRRKPILFQFGSEYASAFMAANRRAAVARGGRSGDRRPIAAENARRPSAAKFEASPLKCPKSKSEAERPVLMGQLMKSGLPPKAYVPDPNLEAALERLRRGVFGKAGGNL
jgi:hypothetical protein